MGSGSSRAIRWLIPIGVCAAVLLAHPLWLGALGSFLVSAEDPFRADLIVVLAGDDTGRRILKAAELVRDGYAPGVLVSGPECCYGRHESDLAIPFAVGKGYPGEWFIPLPIDARSTREEAPLVLDEIRRRGVQHFIIVTSNYHTRRAGSIFRELVPPERFRMVAAPDYAFTPDGWWRDREGRKQAFFEWSKTFANWLGH